MLVVLAFMAAALSAQTPPEIEIPDEGAVVNGASFLSTTLAPGSIISIFGMGIGLELVDGASQPISAAASMIPLGTSLGGHSVTFDGIPAPLFFSGAGSVESGQINLQVPWELANQENQDVEMVVSVDYGDAGQVQSTPMMVPIGSVSPAIFTLDSGPGRAAAVNVKLPDDDVIDGSFAQPADTFGGVPGTPASQPAPIGGVVTVYVNGLGAVDPPADTGDNSADALREVTQPITITVDGINVPSDRILFAGLAPEFVAVYQVSFYIPEGVTPGEEVPLQIGIGGAVSRDDVTIAVRARP